MAAPQTVQADGTVIRARRKELGYAQEALQDLSADLGAPFESFTDKWLRNAENNARVEQQKLVTLAKLLKCNVSELVIPDKTFCPYRGLKVFRKQDAQFFAGRDDAIGEICNRLEETPLVGVIGASGSGKSSVVAAGVLPRLEQDADANWLPITMRPGDNPILALSRSLADSLAVDDDENTRMADIRKREELLSNSTVPLSDFINRILEKASKENLVFLLIVDQWEELYTHCESAKMRSKFITCLLEALENSPLKILLTMRADFHADLLDDDRHFAERLEPGVVPLKRMTRDQLRDAIVKPANVTKLKFDKGLVDQILRDAGEEPGNLPLLEVALRQLWDKRINNTLSFDAYRDMEGLSGAIDRHACTVFEGLEPEQQSTARRVLPRLVHVTEARRDIRQRRPLSEFDDDAQDLLRYFSAEEVWLTTIDGGADKPDEPPTVEIAHEALSRDWKKLKDWVGENPEFLMWQDELYRKYRLWLANDQKGVDLPAGSELRTAESWLETRSSDIQEDLAGFIRKGILRRRKLLRQSTNRRHILIAAGTVVSAVLVGLSFFLFQALDQAKELLSNSQTQESQFLAKLIEVDLSDKPEIAALVALQGLPKHQSDPRAYSNLLFERLDKVYRNKAWTIVEKLGTENKLLSTSISGSGHTKISYVSGGSILVSKDTKSHLIGKSLESIYRFGISKNEKYFAAVSENKIYYCHVECLNLNSLELENTDAASSIAISNDGRTIVVTQPRAISRYRDGSLIEAFELNDPDVKDFFVSGDGKTLVFHQNSFITATHKSEQSWFDSVEWQLEKLDVVSHDESYQNAVWGHFVHQERGDPFAETFEFDVDVVSSNGRCLIIYVKNSNAFVYVDLDVATDVWRVPINYRGELPFSHPSSIAITNGCSQAAYVSQDGNVYVTETGLNPLGDPAEWNKPANEVWSTVDELVRAVKQRLPVTMRELDDSLKTRLGLVGE